MSQPSRRPAVKICGLLTPEQASTAVRLGADLIGLVFAASRRQVSPEQAATLVAAARAAATARGRPIAIVGVFVNEQPAHINALVRALGLDWVQLSGHETPDQAAQIAAPIVKAIRFDGHASEAAWLATAASHPAGATPLLVDAATQGMFGGSGRVADWQRAAELARRRQVWLAGGLTPDNVGMAIDVVQPHVVDVSSGVESNGIKDPAKIAAFLDAVRATAHT
ncbi:phosphoribosylanthranilate isomerase [Kallotenue papyrolyticum]|uniref:phosphoribosylanthranilate isomerase n=1 Tax=Kallotenue papyrolyticum TaxID=1325125 RepID=UPI0004785CA4|nr:hypothetical protein [Kallotenue papyrolyticum]